MRDDAQAVFASLVSIGHGDGRSILHVSCSGVGRRTGEVILRKKSVAFHLSSEENSEESTIPDSCDVAAGTRSALLMRC